MSYVLVIDVGNTNIVFALIDDNANIVAKWRLNTSQNKSFDEYGSWLSSVMQQAGFDCKKVLGTIIASVVPSKLSELKEMCKHYFNSKALVIGDKGLKISSKALIDNPEEMGSDLVCNAVGAYREYGGNLIVVDFGTATTFNIIDENGNDLGGSFVSGVKISLEALYQKTALLPHVEIIKPKKVITTNTIDAMQSGIFWGYLSLIEGMVLRISNEYGKKLKVIATGGLAEIFAEETLSIDVFDKDLTLKGLYYIYKDNRG